MLYIKRRMLVILMVILICLIFSYVNGIMRKSKAVATIAIPATNKVVVIDAGHRNSG